MAKYKILIVEDDTIIRMELQDRLSDMGYDISGMASSGQNAIALATKGRPDLVLMDIRLEGDMDGVDAAEEIREKHNIPVVFLTAYADEDTLKRAKKTDPFGYILKPFDGRMLHTAIEMALYRHKMEKELKRNEQKYRSLFDSVPVGIFRTTSDGEILDANHSLVKMLGYPDKASLLEINATKLYVDLEERKTWQNRIDATGIAQGFEMRLRCKDGKVIWVRNNTREVHDPINGKAYYEGALEDITDQKKAEEALRKAHGELEERVAERTADLLEANKRLNEEIKERRQAVEAHKKSEAELQLLSARLLVIQEEERERIARELHDSVGQCLTFAKMSISVCIDKINQNGDTHMTESLKALLPTIQQAINEVRGICSNLWPSMLDHMGILKTVQWLCEDFQKLNPKIRMETRLKISEENIPHHLKIVIYRLAQEALNNILKHSNANEVDVALVLNCDTIELRIRDNGIGFDLNRASPIKSSTGGIGLASMKKRTEHSGGTFCIKSDSGPCGVIIKASWPCEQPDGRK